MWRSVHQLSLNGPRQCDIPNAGLNHLKVTQGRFEILAMTNDAFTLALGFRNLF